MTNTESFDELLERLAEGLDYSPDPAFTGCHAFCGEAGAAVLGIGMGVEGTDPELHFYRWTADDADDPDLESVLVLRPYVPESVLLVWLGEFAEMAKRTAVANS